MHSYFKFGGPLMVEACDQAQYSAHQREQPGGHEMLRQLFQRMLLLGFAVLAGLAGAAGPQMGQATKQDVADASRVALAGHSDGYAPYDYRALSDGGSYYAPGSYGSWFYVTPPASEAVASATEPVPAPSYQAPSYEAPPPALHKYYDYDRYIGPLFG
jgi:hypothetical protein